MTMYVDSEISFSYIYIYHSTSLLTLAYEMIIMHQSLMPLTYFTIKSLKLIVSRQLFLMPVGIQE